MNWFKKSNPKTGEVEQAQEKVKIDFTAKNRRKDVVNKVIKVHLELEMEYPEKMDIVQAIRDTKTSFELPLGIELLDAHLAHVELLGEPDEL